MTYFMGPGIARHDEPTVAPGAVMPIFLVPASWVFAQIYIVHPGVKAGGFRFFRCTDEKYY